MYSKMLKDFINHIERRVCLSGWQIISKTSYEANSFRKKMDKQRPPISKQQNLKLFLEWMEMGEKDLDFEIETFLKNWKEQ